MKFFKIGLSVIGGIILLLVVVAGIFIATFNGDEYKSLIAEQVKQQTGRDILLGDIKPSVFPWIGIELTQISLSNAADFKAEKMLQIASLDVRLELVPLLSQQISIDTLRIHGLTLFLEKDRQGKTNWDDLITQSAGVEADKTKSATDAGQQEVVASDPLAALVVNGIDIKDASINWNDVQSGQSINLKKFNVTTGAIRTGVPLPVELSAQLSLSEPEVNVAVALQTEIEFDLQTQKINLNELSFVIDAALQQGDLKQLKLALTSAAKLDLKQQRYNLPEYTLDINLQGPAIPSGKMQLLINGDADIDLNKQTASIKELGVVSGELKIKSQLNVTRLLESPKVKGELLIDEFNPSTVAKMLDISLPETQSQSVLQKTSLALSFTADDQSLDVASLKLMFDASILQATASIKDFAKPKIKYTLTLDQINLDDYLPPPAEPVAAAPVAAAKTSQAKADTPIDLPVDLLRSLNVNGVVQVKTINAFKQTIHKLKIKTLAHQGLIKVPVIQAELLQGTINASASLDVRKNIPKYQFKLKARNLNADSVVNPILQDMLGEKSVSMSGKTQLDMNIHSRGKSVKQLIAGSNGTLKLNMGEAKLHGVDAEYFVRKGVVDYIKKKKQKVPKAWQGEYKPKETTALNIARASATMTNGVLDNKDLLLDSPRLKISGAGKINLPKEKLNYRVVIDVKPTRTVTPSERLLDIPMPVFVKGKFAQPQISIDSKVWLKSVGKELKAEVKKEMKQKLKKEKNKKIDKLKNKYKDKLKGWFK